MLLIFSTLLPGGQQSTLAGGRAQGPLIYVSRKLKIFPHRVLKRKFLSSVALTLNAAAGAYTMTGDATTLLRAALLSADPGTFAISGTASLTKTTAQTATAVGGSGLVGFGIHRPMRRKKKPKPRQMATIDEENEAFLLLAA
jgi:hypothetical protein